MVTSSTDPTVGRFARVSSLRSYLYALPDLRDRPYSEALFTTFNVDLGYFEGHILGPARASGAAVTVIADGAQYEPDPRAVRGAGSSYAVGVVDLPTAFHPKVSALVGHDRLLLAIGSGNLTTGGWLGNDETLFIAQGTTATGIPAIAGQVARWLKSIETLRVSRAGRAGIERTRLAIERLLTSNEVVDTNHRLVTTSSGPILDQLPDGQVDELLLHAPFHDDKGTALGALLDRYRPRQVSIAVQPGRTIIDPNPLAAAARSRGVDLTWHDAGGTYRHGKLIEAVSGGRRWVLTGSPNLTGAALLRQLGAGGNCEVGVVATTDRSLYPGEGAPLAVGDVPSRRILVAPGEVSRSSQHVPVLLGATLDGEAIVIELSRPAPFPVTVEVSEFSDLPERSSVLGQVPAGATEVRIEVTREFGARSRVRISFESDGDRYRGPLHFLADPHAILHRVPSRRSSSTNSDVDWRALFGDDALLRDWTRTLDKVTREQRVLPAVGSRPTSSAQSAAIGKRGRGRTFDDEEGWAQYSVDAIARLGPTLAHETSGGLILPQLATRARTTISSSDPIWADTFDADESSFDDSQTAEDLDGDRAPETDTSGPADLATPQLKQRFRSWVNSLATTVAERPALDRMAITRMLLIASLVHVWDEDVAWFHPLYAATQTLSRDDVPARISPAAGALSAVCLYRLNQGASPDRRTGTGLHYVQLVEQLLPLIATRDTGHVSSIVYSVFGTSAVATHPQDVLDLIEGILDKNPWSEIVESIQRTHPDWDVELIEGTVNIESRSGSHFKIAAAALELMPRGLSAAIRVTSGRQLEERVYARHGDVLVLQDRLGTRLVWKTYRLSSLVSPSVIQGSPDAEARARIDGAPWSGLSATARTVLDAAGVTV